MDEKIIAVVKQPIASNIVRGIYYIIFGGLMIVVMGMIGRDLFRMMDSLPYLIIIPILGVVLPILGVGDIILAIVHSGVKENSISIRNGKVVFYGHVLATPLFTKNKVIEMDAAKVKASCKNGSAAASIAKWWKLCLDDGNKSVTIRILKFLKGDMESLLNTLNNNK